MIPGSGISPGEGNGYPFQYSCLENSMERSLVGYIHGVTESDLATEQAHAHFLPGTVKEIFLQMDTFIINVNLPCKRVNSTAFRDSPVNVQFE